MNELIQGTTASLIAGILTGLGGLFVFIHRKYIDNYFGMSLGFCAGVMLAATSFSLIIPGINYSIAHGTPKALAALIMATGMLIGWKLLKSTHQYAPVEKLFKNKLLHQKIWLFILVMAVHNFPEGMAVGVSFLENNTTHGISVAIGIGLQNIPEGLAVALSLLGLGYSRTFSILIALSTGLVEPIGGFLGCLLFHQAHFLLPLGMAFAAGTMLVIITEELIPEAYQKSSKPNHTTFGLMIGFILMMFLDIVFG